jgi:hypothetical protein
LQIMTRALTNTPVPMMFARITAVAGISVSERSSFPVAAGD